MIIKHESIIFCTYILQKGIPPFHEMIAHIGNFSQNKVDDLAHEITQLPIESDPEKKLYSHHDSHHTLQK